MCLAVPAKLMNCSPGKAVVDLHGNRLCISTALVADVKVGDWVLIHAGFAIEKLDEDEAKKRWKLVNEFTQLQNQPAGELP